MKTGQHIVVAGLGNTGAFVALLLARMPGVARLILVDPDTYTESNIMAQNIDSSDIGQPKVLAQAAKLRRINPDSRWSPCKRVLRTSRAAFCFAP